MKEDKDIKAEALKEIIKRIKKKRLKMAGTRVGNPADEDTEKSYKA